MPIAIIAALVSLLEQGIVAAPSIIAAVKTAIGLIESGTAPTTAQQAEIDAALDTAHATLQAAVQGA
jgi:hypothetical protein